MSRKSTVKRGDTITDDMSERDTCRALGISRRQAWTWKQIATIPEADFEAAIADMRAGKRKLTDESLVNMARHRATSERRCPNCGHVLRKQRLDIEGQE